LSAAEPATHAGAQAAHVAIDAVPEALRSRPLSMRAFDDDGMIVEAELVDGREMAGAVERLFANPGSAYIHVHDARRGCCAARVDRLADQGLLQPQD
jgi:hypothetical protein